MHFTLELIPEALRIMGLGMGGLFIAMFVLYLISTLLLKVFPEKKDGTSE